MSEYRKDYLGDEDTTTHFLFCNAHLLLGLARATGGGVKEVQEGLHCELGRDEQAGYGHFSSSTKLAAIRAIRTSAECLGPRCDEKSGSRMEWSAYCLSINIRSKLISHGSNRFNNLFENAGAIFSIINTSQIF
ncbi:hypothetical protein PoB_001992900 [Plakobranchus ocellatus]|uniref:Uncharacterized protein n=1 Tax=Plakobranchus ocellatus TaxID=259542 RepID=A0AAV3ZGD5_9GAST|nr:hypothetical protein PoB_001992900 [Plakobranchus ocellatus]